ncbi:cysteine synthase [Streptomyces virginiae]|uniref:Cysteine synthase n=1 Tax=Streptomyces virginiae TaxID=1961 RepID=A0ABQ3NG12_STRVG|nr:MULTISPECIES: pyridoxal-phosphate dependent enzyme [Streptomyces]MBP2347021.1 cysteine synthase A [Streptomyces virginiae]MCI4084236.1 pyridoxal-phosphate dependent enzyme [Streptomyces sp. MMS21 TC-5]RSS85406.1 pyridoxal-phosphate dependent enzyme [Streptomyces sp. WAC05950]GGQ01636.1 cysteine synthase [Streptomyces virginiae]GHI11715.1 cysteine synthase [Streptomyces virginiae]
MDQHIAEAIGRPDLIRLDDRLVCLRFETMKVVSALAAVRHLLDTGVVRPGDTLLDSSSGIYAYALALACHRHGMHCHIVGSTTVDHTLRTQLAVLGATLEQMEPCSDLKLDQKRRVERVHEILAEHPGHHWMRQYHDDVHYLGYRAVADLVRASTGGEALTVVGGVGSGASTGALAHYLREDAPDTELVGVQPFGSVTFGAGHVADPEIIIAGIGSSIPFGNVRHASYDTLHWISFDAALAGSVDLLRRHAVFAGLSTGAGYLAARWERDRSPERTVLFVAADTGHRYVDTVYARHREAVPIGSLAPRQVAGQEGLALPWSRTDWNRADPPS